MSLSNRGVATRSPRILAVVPKLWTETIETHRRTVRDAAVDATVALVRERGLRSATMSEIAEATGVGRATLYKYFRDVESVLLAWHEREIGRHLEELARVRDQAKGAGARLEAVLEAYALIAHEPHGHHDAELVSMLHRDEQVMRAEHLLREMVRRLIVDATTSGEVRRDVAPDELAIYCLRALGAAKALRSRAAVRRLVSVTLAGLRPQP
jgi:AcrR family transcriptional regulator